MAQRPPPPAGTLVLVEWRDGLLIKGWGVRHVNPVVNGWIITIPRDRLPSDLIEELIAHAVVRGVDPDFLYLTIAVPDSKVIVVEDALPGAARDTLPKLPLMKLPKESKLK